jgi:hypothetical protein
MGLDLSMSSLAAGILISLIGAALLLYGRKETRVPHMVAGVILIVFPYFVGIWWLAILIAVVIVVGLAVVSRLGY